jgi:RNA polymerase sigma factor (sigma-70 family)
VLGILRGRIRNKGAELNSEELADAWQEAMLNLMKIVSDDQLQQRGALIGLLLCLVSCRYIDQVRRRLRRDEDSDPDNGFVHFRVDQAHDLDELRIVVVDAMATLSEREQLVMQAFYGLFDEYDSPPSVADVREELQLQQIECSKGSVRSALQRGRAKMRCILKQRGYGNEP